MRVLLFDVLAAPLATAWGGVLVGMQHLSPLRSGSGLLARRARTNAALGVAALALTRLAVLPALVSVARHTQRRRIGVLRAIPPGMPRALAGFLALDCGMYWWHRMSHESPLLWRLHVVHHSDPELDLTTALRLHPAELLASLLVRGAQVGLLGVHPALLLTYELAVQLATLLQHSNVDFGPACDRIVSRVLMTPRLHTRHHAAEAVERRCNWGVVLTLWDRLFGSFTRQEAAVAGLGTSELCVGDPQQLRVRDLLRMPRSL